MALSRFAACPSTSSGRGDGKSAKALILSLSKDERELLNFKQRYYPDDVSMGKKTQRAVVTTARCAGYYWLRSELET